MRGRLKRLSQFFTRASSQFFTPAALAQTTCPKKDLKQQKLTCIYFVKEAAQNPGGKG
jgi:hypothetical protein